MYLNRTRLVKDIVCEFLPPLKKTKKVKVIISCSGAPSVPSKKTDFAEFFAKKGYWFFTFRYRGSWESSGRFLAKSPAVDVEDIINHLAKKSFIEAYSKKIYRLHPDEFIIIGGSFGGPAALLNSKNPLVSKVVVDSSVIDWRYPSKEEPMEKMYDFYKLAFGEGYRFRRNDWDKLSKGNFYNPISSLDKIEGSKILMLHNLDDKICSIVPVKKFSSKTGSKLKTYKRGGHGVKITKPHVWKVVADFLKS